MLDSDPEESSLKLLSVYSSTEIIFCRYIKVILITKKTSRAENYKRIINGT